MASKMIGENDRCTFYRTDRCKELEQLPEYINKYGEGCRFVFVKFKPIAEAFRRGTNDKLAREYIIYDKTGEPVGEMIEHSQEWEERLLHRVMNSLNGLPE